MEHESIKEKQENKSHKKTPLDQFITKKTTAKVAKVRIGEVLSNVSKIIKLLQLIIILII